MQRLAVAAVVFLFVAFLFAGCEDVASPPGAPGSSDSSGSGPLLAGAAAVPITPTGFETWTDRNGNGEYDWGEPFDDANGDGIFQGLVISGFQGAYYLKFRMATGIHDDLWARTLALKQGKTTLLLQSLDLVGMLHVDINPVKRRIERELSVPFANIVIASTHNHQGPDPVGLWAGSVDEAYLAEVRERMFLSAKKALAALVPVRLKSVTAYPPAGYDPDTHEIKTEPHVKLPMQGTDVAAGLPGYDRPLLQTDLRDPYVRHTAIVALQLVAKDGGHAVATWINWANHPEVLESKNTLISSDFPHYVRLWLEKKLGGICVYSSGTVGCQIGSAGKFPVPLVDDEGHFVADPELKARGIEFPKLVREAGFEKIRSIGYLVARVAADALAAAELTPRPALSIRTEDLDVDVENPLQWGLSYFLVTRPALDPRDRPIRTSYLKGPVGGVRTQLSVIHVGKAQLVTAPGEMPPEYLIGRKASVAKYPGFPDYLFPAMPALRDHMTGREKAVIGLANTYLSYLIPQSDFLPLLELSHPNHYEEKVSAGKKFGDNVGNKLMELLGSPVRFSGDPVYPKTGR